MSSLAEKRVYGESTGPTVLALACPVGVATVAVADDRVGEFGLAIRCDARDLAVTAASAAAESAANAADAPPAAGPALAVATPDDVLFVEVTADGGAGEADSAGRATAAVSDSTPSATGFGPAVAVSGLPQPPGTGPAPGSVLAAAPDGRIASLIERTWTDLGTLPAVEGLDGALAATTDGVWMLRDGESPARLALGGHSVADVTAGPPLAATADGLFDLGESSAAANSAGPRLLEGSFRAVASESGGEEVAASGRAHAATDDALFARDPADGTWSAVDLPVEESVADVAYGVGAGAGDPQAAGTVTYAATVDGTLLVDAGDGWRSRALGLQGVQAVVVVG